MIEVVHLAVLLGATTTTKKSSASIVPLLVIVAIAFGGYFLFLRPQQQKNRAARQQGQTIEVGDEVQTIGGIIGTVVEMDNDRVTIVSGGGQSGAPPTQLVLMRAAIAKKVEARVAPSDGGLRYGDRDAFDDHDHDTSTADDHDEDESPSDDDEGEKPR
jgi:preprotein translocase subunit YajC